MTELSKKWHTPEQMKPNKFLDIVLVIADNFDHKHLGTYNGKDFEACIDGQWQVVENVSHWHKLKK
ncbi:hypothetical protein EDC56_0421 [Sinobacterium caligoides]|uniref:Uncharacterized protein n=1 Tax=Sinobacterium caligoides TaxID=933926 RepID=A0A3N2E008_9GAMM|nr:hypothetical protein [Sinobacterium caligoides]ROS04905.1 hypothetical protein EDC56_0421 [Sinobacterium caligoides]